MSGAQTRNFQMIIECLGRHRVSFVVIGGAAAMLRDIPIPETFDVDVVAARDRKNLKALANALREMEARLRIAGDPEGIEVPLDERTVKDMSTMTLVTRFGAFDVLFEPTGAPPYEELVSHALVLERFGTRIPVASVDDLIAMKRSTGREKDAIHLAILVEHQNDRDRKDGG